MSNDAKIEQRLRSAASIGISHPQFRPISDGLIEAANYISDLEHQLAEAKADILDYHLADEDCRKASAEFDKSDSFCTESPLTIIERNWLFENRYLP